MTPAEVLARHVVSAGEWPVCNGCGTPWDDGCDAVEMARQLQAAEARNERLQDIFRREASDRLVEVARLEGLLEVGIDAADRAFGAWIGIHDAEVKAGNIHQSWHRSEQDFWPLQRWLDGDAVKRTEPARAVLALLDEQPVTGTLAAPLARALVGPGGSDGYLVDMGFVDVDELLAALRSDPAVLAALAEALPRAINFRFLPPRPVNDPIWTKVAVDLLADLVGPP